MYFFSFFSVLGRNRSNTTKYALQRPKLPKKNSGELKDLDEKVNSMIGRGENMIKVSEHQMAKVYVCQVCGKEGQGKNIRRHIEVKHLERISIPCNSCAKTFSSREALSLHKSKNHNIYIC